MFCRNCGAPVAEGARFCSKCGCPAEEGSLAGSAQGQQTSFVSQPSFQGQSPEQASFADQTLQAAPPSRTDQVDKKKRAFLIGGIVTALVAAAVIFGVAFKMVSSNKEQERQAARELEEEEAQAGEQEQEKEGEKTDIAQAENGADATELPGDTGSPQREDPREIAMKALALPGQAGQTVSLQYINYGEYNYSLTGVSEPQLLSADLYDYDGDGADEILAIVLVEENQSVFMRVCMLEKVGTAWGQAATLEPTQYYSNEKQPGFELGAHAVDERQEFFTRVDESGEVWLLFEQVGWGGHFSDGEYWELSAYTYKDQNWRQAKETVYIAGSSEIEAYFEMDLAAAAAEPEIYDVESVQDFIDQVHGMGVYPTGRLSIENPLTDSDGNLRKILRLGRTDEFSDEDYARLERGETAGLVKVEVTDFAGMENP